MDRVLRELEREHAADPENTDLYLRLLFYAAKIQDKQYFEPYLEYLIEKDCCRRTAINKSCPSCFEGVYFKGKNHDLTESVWIKVKSGDSEAINGDTIDFLEKSELSPPHGWLPLIDEIYLHFCRYRSINIYTKHLIIEAANIFGLPLPVAHKISLGLQYSDWEYDYIRQPNGNYEKIYRGEEFPYVDRISPTSHVVCDSDYSFDIWGDPNAVPKSWIKDNPGSELEKIRLDPDLIKKEFPLVVVRFRDHYISIDHIAPPSPDTIRDDDTEFSVYREELFDEWRQFYTENIYQDSSYGEQAWLFGVGVGYDTAMFVAYGGNEHDAFEAAQELWPSWFTDEDAEENEEEYGDEYSVEEHIDLRIWEKTNPLPARVTKDGRYELITGKIVDMR